MSNEDSINEMHRLIKDIDRNLLSDEIVNKEKLKRLVYICDNIDYKKLLEKPLVEERTLDKINSFTLSELENSIDSAEYLKDKIVLIEKTLSDISINFNTYDIVSELDSIIDNISSAFNRIDTMIAESQGE